MHSHYRPLLPAPGSQPNTPSSSSASGGNGKGNGGKGSPDRSRRRYPVQPSCIHCRARKTRCDREKPTCSTCQKRGIVCNYKEKIEIDAESTEILEALQSMSQQQAFETLKVLRSTRDTAAVLNMTKHSGEPANDDPEHNHGLEIGVAAQSPLERELISFHPKAYASVSSVSVSSLVESDLLRPVSRTRTPSPQADSASKQPPNKVDSVDGYPPTVPGADPDSAVRRFRANEVTVPSSAQPYCDDRLHSLQISLWTDIPISNDLAARVLSLYLATDHPLLGLFDPQLFIADLISGGQTFCSRFLVHAVLYWGCQIYTAIEKSAHDVVNAFWEETERLWLIEKASGALLDTTLNMAGTQLLSLACMGHGRDGEVLNYLAEGIQIGKRLRLLGVDEATAREHARQIPDGMLSASSFAAWGVFNWAVLCSLFYRQPGLECPESPPVLPTPGELSVSVGADSFGQGGIPPLPPYMGDTFSALCRFWNIVHGFGYTWGPDEPNIPHHHHLSRLEYTEYKFRELLAWAENLPTSLVRGEDSPHHVVILHIWFHCVIVDIFRPFTGSESSQSDTLKTFTCLSPPKAAYSASIEQLKDLVVQYRSKYEASTYTILWHTALINVANAVLQDTPSPESHSYFLICIYGYEALNRPYRMSAVVGQSLLTMALRDGNISSSEAREMVKQLKRRRLSPQRSGVRATFMADLNLAMTDTEAAKVENLAAKFEEMAFFREFILLDGEGDMDLA